MWIVGERVCGARGQADNSRDVIELGIPFHRITFRSINLTQRRGMPCRLQKTFVRVKAREPVSGRAVRTQCENVKVKLAGAS